MHVLDLPQLSWRIDQKRKEHGLSWDKVAAQTGVSSSALWRIGQGGAPHGDTLVALMVWLGLTDISVLTLHRDWATPSRKREDAAP